ncbi:MAG: hypothetical protein M4D80_01555 [Myxococcota bacterium]|nr:hypothetical protein [Deltaproteobacteria bacterium]MDQ3333843.1 hypothetical protein [Myxococcota bacterium]
MKYVVLALLAFGCQDAKKKPAPAPPPTPAATPQRELCVVALAMFERFVDTGDPGATPEQVGKVKIALIDRCVQDSWSEAALACMRAAKDPHATFACWNEHLTKEQRDAASKALGSLGQ